MDDIDQGKHFSFIDGKVISYQKKEDLIREVSENIMIHVVNAPSILWRFREH